MGWYRWEGEDLCLMLKVQPRAKRNAFLGPLEDCYRIQITAPPVDGKANAHLRRFLADAFGVSPSQVELEAGASSRTKRVRVRAPKRLPIADAATKQENAAPSARRVDRSVRASQ
jgi:uncharacterized protein (TIGR00251 family)